MSRTRIQINNKLYALLLTLAGLSWLPSGLAEDPKSTCYVPEPKPLQNNIDVHAFYYPGTEWMPEWDMVAQTLPQIKPLLGWYDEGNPEVIDWQIKWAVENGISVFYVDWYWNQGVQRLDHWLKGYYQAKYRSYFKWCVMWANHNQPGAHSTEDMLHVTRFWLEHYFNTPEYYRIDDQPVVQIWAWKNIDRDFIDEAKKNGEILKEGDGIKRALELCRKEVQTAGLKGIYFVAMNASANHYPLLKEAGFNETGSYGYQGETVFNRLSPEEQEVIQKEYSPRHTPYKYVVKTIPDVWKERLETCPDLPFMVFIPTGYDDRPRRFDNSVITVGRNPELFREVCQKAAQFCRKHGIRHVVLGPINEWQEGSILEPNEEYGFDYYHVLREVFCQVPEQGWPKDLTPQQYGLGPYDYPPMEIPARTQWTFEQGNEGWYRMPYGAPQIRVVDGKMKLIRMFQEQPAMRIRLQPFRADDFSKLVIRLKVACIEPDGKELAQIQWSRTDSPILGENLVINRKNSLKTSVNGNGQWQEITFDFSDSPEWKGLINELWFDPVNRAHAKVEIDTITFVK